MSKRLRERLFPCRYCGGTMEVSDSRPTVMHGHHTVRRRRRCRKCGYAMTTCELPVHDRKQTFVNIGRVIMSLRRAREAIDDLIVAYDDPDQELPHQRGGGGESQLPESSPRGVDPEGGKPST